MNTDELLTEFRSEVALPDAATAQRIYALATRGRPRVVARRRLAVALVVVVAGAGAALSSVILTGGTTPRSDGGSHEALFDPGKTLNPGLGATDWSHPGGNLSRSVSSVAEAASDVAFQPVAPPSLGAPTALALDPESGNEQLTRADAQLTIAYADVANGPFWLVERASGATTTDTLAGYAQECDSRRCYGTWTMESLDGGNQGLLIEGPTGSTTAVVWVQNGVYFNVVGPADSFSADQATSVANAVIAAAG
jgi:hypothetical protein